MSGPATRRWLTSLCICGLIAAAQVSVSLSALPAITVGPNVHVSGARAEQVHDEVLLAADPANRSHLLACSAVGPAPSGHYGTATYVSFDQGLTWQPGVHEAIGIGDPSCSYGIDGSANFLTISGNDSGDDTRWSLTAYHSDDGGRVWMSAVVPNSKSPDRPYVIADVTTSKYRGRLYIFAQSPGDGLDDNPIPYGITLWRSLDNGRSYQRPVRRFPRDDKTAFWPGNPVILSDGTVIELIEQVVDSKRNDGYGGSYRGPVRQPGGVLKVIGSTDGGETLNKATTVSDAYVEWRHASSGVPSLAVDASSGPFRDRLYAVWIDGRYTGRDQVLLSFSTDKGESWSIPRIVNDDRRPAHGGLERNPANAVVAVNKNGAVGVTWCDRRENTKDEISYYERFATSLDGGETFSRSVRVSSEPRVFGKNEQWAVAAFEPAKRNSIELARNEWGSGGHTAGLAADADGIFHPLWIDNRTGIHQVWTSAVTVRGYAIKNGSADLADLTDVSERVMMEVVDSAYDRNKHTVTLTVRLKNTSTSAVAGPIKLRAMTILSGLGDAAANNADNGVRFDGAVWDFLPPDGALAGGKTTRARQLLFRLSNIIIAHPGSDESYDRPGILSLQGKILATH